MDSRISNTKGYKGEGFIYEVILRTQNPNIVGIEIETQPVFDGFKIQKLSGDKKLIPVREKDDVFYEAVIERYYLESEESGNKILKGGKYIINFSDRNYSGDPFFNFFYPRVSYTEYSEAEDIKLKILDLPKKGKSEEFSGALGDFEIEATLPDGKIISGQEAVFLVTITGEGDLSKIELPDIKKSFGDRLVVKSVTGFPERFWKDGKFYSELEIECVFEVENEGDYRINEIFFNFFNPKKGKYEIKKTNPIDFKVENFIDARKTRRNTYSI